MRADNSFNPTPLRGEAWFRRYAGEYALPSAAACTNFGFGRRARFRVLYVARFTDAIYVLHAFEKKTQKTASLDIEIGIRRYRRSLNQRQKS